MLLASNRVPRLNLGRALDWHRDYAWRLIVNDTKWVFDQDQIVILKVGAVHCCGRALQVLAARICWPECIVLHCVTGNIAHLADATLGSSVVFD